MGYTTEGQVVVTNLIGPGPDATHREAFFQPDAAYQLAEIERQYHDSGRMITYLGDWHTHPRATGYLSTTDRHALRVIAEAPDSQQRSPLMAILAGGHPWVLTTWRYRQAWFGWSADPLQTRIY
jgi:integrative and conjugative element protein (TIGR02256 family)